MAAHPTRRRAALIALVSVLVLLAAVAGVAGGAAAAAAPPAPTPHLGLSWTVIEHRCWTATERVPVHLRRHRRITVKKRHVRRCGDRPVKAHGRALHLAWRHHGEVFGHLTLARQPIANATINLTWTVPGSANPTGTVTTNSQGRFSALIHGPCSLVTLSYQPPAAPPSRSPSTCRRPHSSRCISGNSKPATARGSPAWSPAATSQPTGSTFSERASYRRAVVRAAR
jgi:hypothetical protein